MIGAGEFRMEGIFRSPAFDWLRELTGRRGMEIQDDREPSAFVHYMDVTDRKNPILFYVAGKRNHIELARKDGGRVIVNRGAVQQWAESQFKALEEGP